LFLLAIASIQFKFKTQCGNGYCSRQNYSFTSKPITVAQLFTENEWEEMTVQMDGPNTAEKVTETSDTDVQRKQSN